MIIPPIEALASQSPELVAVLSDDDGLKLSEFDTSLDVKAPYACWQIVTANPEKYLDAPGDMDAVLVQIDVYAVKKSDARHIAKLLRGAIEEDCYIAGYRGIQKDPETNLYRISIDTSWQLEP